VESARFTEGIAIMVMLIPSVMIARSTILLELNKISEREGFPELLPIFPGSTSCWAMTPVWAPKKVGMVEHVGACEATCCAVSCSSGKWWHAPDLSPT